MPRLLPQDCLKYGFTNAAALDPAALTPLPEVREMCAANRCKRFQQSWSCPPAVGELDALAREMHTYPYGVLLQYTAQLEDAFDIETMQATERACKAALDALIEDLRAVCRRIFPMAVGACTRCEKCSYPDAPCRYPERRMPSMEACGLLVGSVCEQCGVPYYYGQNTVTYVCAVLLDDATEPRGAEA